MSKLIERVRERIHAHRARWSADKLLPWLRTGDRVLDVGAGGCSLDLILQTEGQCEVTPVDVQDFNRTQLKLTLFDGVHLPFPDDSFDVVLLLFVLHHAEDVAAVLAEARRVSRRHVIVFEDINVTFADRMIYRVFHRLLEYSEGISRPHHELTPQQWLDLARRCGLEPETERPLGRQLGYFASRHVGYVWAKRAAAKTVAA